MPGHCLGFYPSTESPWNTEEFLPSVFDIGEKIGAVIRGCCSFRICQNLPRRPTGNFNLGNGHWNGMVFGCRIWTASFIPGLLFWKNGRQMRRIKGKQSRDEEEMIAGAKKRGLEVGKVLGPRGAWGCLRQISDGKRLTKSLDDGEVIAIPPQLWQKTFFLWFFH